MPAYFTIGHSTRSVSELIALLQGAGVKLLADVRAIPRSRTNPQFNIEALPTELAESGIAYEHFPELGGRRGRALAASPNQFWGHASFRNYADYAGTQAFRAGLERLRRLGQQQCTAIMCAEAVWWRCHRALISDYLKARGIEVIHIVDSNKTEPHPFTSAARMVNGELSYAASEPLL
jgi:uncharacterized protein (DUF488 family)